MNRLAPPTRWTRRLIRRSDLHQAGRFDLPEAAAFVQAAGPDGVLAGAKVVDKMSSKGVFGEVWMAGQPGRPRGVCWFGGSLTPVGFSPSDAESLADQARGRSAGCGSLVGQAELVLPIWQHLAPAWPTPREVRPDQPLLEITTKPRLEPDRLVRCALNSEIDLVLPAAIAMFTEELGFPPPSPHGSYRRRVAELIERRQTFIRFGPIPSQAQPGIQFKADVGATIGPNAQIHGVWTHPQLRGRGLARHGLATVIAATQARGYSSISLYVNATNHSALAAYQALGFQRCGTWATVLL